MSADCSPQPAPASRAGATLLEKTLACVAVVRGALGDPRPEELDQALPALEKAGLYLAELEAQLRAQDVRPDAGLRISVARLERELSQLRGLLESWAGFHARRAGLLLRMASGYTAAGLPLAQPPRQSVRVEA